MRGLLRIVFVLIYTFGQLFNCVSMLGGGHGTILFLMPLLSWFLILACVLMLSWSRFQNCRIAFVMTLLFHYGVTLALIYITESPYSFEYTLRTLRVAPIGFAISVIWYLAGQVILWYAFFIERRKFHPPLP
jgi:hypothetical protein